MTAIAVRRPAPLRGLARTALAFGVGLLVLVGFLTVAGYDVGPALAALWRGAFGSRDAILSATLVRSVPLLLLGLAFALGARAGGLNIGMEGQFAVGAIAATWIGLAVGGWPVPLAIGAVLLAGTIAGLLWMVVPVALRARFGVTEVISTLLLNFVAEAAVSWMVAGPLQEANGTYPQSDPIAQAARLPRLFVGDRVHLGLVLALLIAVAMAVVFQRSRLGFALRAAGAGPAATRISGRAPLSRLIALALLGSGALAGLGGAVEVSGVSYALYQRLSPGYGFTAIAVALLGRLRPMAIVVAALLFGALEAGAGAMQRDAGVPAVAVMVVEAVVILAMVLGQREES